VEAASGAASLAPTGLAALERELWDMTAEQAQATPLLVRVLAEASRLAQWQGDALASLNPLDPEGIKTDQNWCKGRMVAMPQTPPISRDYIFRCSRSIQGAEDLNRHLDDQAAWRRGRIEYEAQRLGIEFTDKSNADIIREIHAVWELDPSLRRPVFRGRDHPDFDANRKAMEEDNQRRAEDHRLAQAYFQSAWEREEERLREHGRHPDGDGRTGTAAGARPWRARFKAGSSLLAPAHRRRWYSLSAFRTCLEPCRQGPAASVGGGGGDRHPWPRRVGS